jgi:hypothetical protein
MISAWIILTALLLLLILAVFGFTGCASFSGDETTDPYPTVITNTNGIAARWPLDETAPGPAKLIGSLTSALDGQYIGTVKLGLPSGIKTTNHAPQMDGTTAYVEVPFDKRLNPAPKVAFSVELWVKPALSGGATTQIVISSHQKDATNDQGYEISLVRSGQAHQEVVARVFKDARSTELRLQPSVGAADAWRHIVLTYQPDGPDKGVSLYVNVVPSASASTKSADLFYQPVQSNAITLRFGAGHQPLPTPAPVGFFNGQIDEVAFYNVALLPPDVQKHFQAY